MSPGQEGEEEEEKLIVQLFNSLGMAFFCFSLRAVTDFCLYYIKEQE